MPRTFIRQISQIRNSDTYTDNIAVGATMESAATTIEDDLNNLRSQVNRIIDDSGAGNWYDDIPTVTGLGIAKTRSILDLNTDLDGLEEKRFLFRTQVLTDIAVPAAQNWVVLSVAGTETPTLTGAVGVVTTTGAVVANTAGFDAAALDEVAGTTAITPQNLVIIRNSANGDPIISSNSKVIYGLIQSESSTDGHTFDDAAAQVQISFVEENAAGTDLVATLAADIATLSINYAYTQRQGLDSLPSDAYLSGVFVDQSASSDVTLSGAVTNQVGDVAQVQNINVNVADTFAWEFHDSTGANALVSIAPAAGGDVVQFNVDTFDVNNTATADFLNGASFDTGGTPITIGETVGYIETAAAADLGIRAGAELFLDDVNQTGSTWAQTGGIKLSEATTDWDTWEINFGEVSIMEAMNSLATSDTVTKTYALVTAQTAADTDLNLAGNLDAALGDYSGATVDFLTDVDVFVNGVLMRNGANAAANHDVYPGTSAAAGDLRFEFQIEQDDQIIMIVRS